MRGSSASRMRPAAAYAWNWGKARSHRTQGRPTAMQASTATLAAPASCTPRGISHQMLHWERRGPTGPRGAPQLCTPPLPPQQLLPAAHHVRLVIEYANHDHVLFASTAVASSNLQSNGRTQRGSTATHASTSTSQRLRAAHYKQLYTQHDEVGAEFQLIEVNTCLRCWILRSDIAQSSCITHNVYKVTTSHPILVVLVSNPDSYFMYAWVLGCFHSRFMRASTR